MIEEIKKLAKESIEEKWDLIDEDSEWEEWVSACAFCRDALSKVYNEGGYHQCSVCYIEKMKICDNVEDCMGRNDKSLIVKALEELAEFGELSLIVKVELER